MRGRSLGFVVFAAAGLLGLAGCGQESPVSPGEVTSISLQVVSGGGQTGNVGTELPQPLVVRVMDAAGRKPVKGMPVSFVATSGGGDFYAGSSVTDADGYASDYWRLGPTPGAQAAEARAVLGQAAERRVFGAFTATAIGPAAKLAFSVQPSTVMAGMVIAPAVQVQVQDGIGQRINSSTATVTLAITPGTGAAGATLGGTLSRAAVAGVADFSDLTLAQAAAGYTLTATAVNLESDTSSAFLVAPGPAAALAFDRQPANGAAGTTLAPVVVAVRDAYGNSVPTAADFITLSLTVGTGTAGAVLGGTLLVQAAGGTASFNDLSVDRTGTGYTLTAASGLLSSAISNPFAIASGVTLASVEAGADFACGLTESGAAYCWGDNTHGQLGNGTTASTYRPVAVTGGLGFVQLAAGTGHVCGVTASSADVYCWGDNTLGQLGIGSTTPSTVPEQVILTNAQGTSPQLAAGATHTCLLTAAGGAVLCWGDNASGQLGLGSVGGMTNRPTGLVSGGGYWDIVAGDRHTCARAPTGETNCWGNNQFGQLGLGTVSGPIPVPQMAGGGRPFNFLAAGAQHTCGLAFGITYCWGDNAYGQLGIGGGSLVPSPAPVSLPAASQLSAGDRHTCAIIGAGTLYCWGSNQFGQFGNGTTAPVVGTPVLSAGGASLLRITTGGGFSCAVRGTAPATRGAAVCFGLNANGQIGDGTTTNRTVPTDVLF